MTTLVESNSMLARIVRSIVKAINEDVPEYLREHGKETNNCVIHLRGDCINDNLRKYVVGETVDLLSFKRYSWQGRMLVDRMNKHSYTITTRNNLQTIPRMHRNSPHFLQTVLSALNRDLEAPVKQMAFIDNSPFEDDTLKNDYKSIVGEFLNPAEGYHHYVIIYETVGTDVSSVSMELLDKDFDVVESRSLNEFLQPDILRLIDSTPIIEEAGTEEEGSAKKFVRIKNRARPHVSDLPESGVFDEPVADNMGLRPRLQIADEEA